MTDVEFVQAVNHITSYLGYQRTLTPQVLAAWHNKIQSIPTEAVPYIVQRITDEAENMPRNVPKLFRELYSQWLVEHPHKGALAQEHFCGQCYDGILWLQRGTRTAAIFCACYRGNPGQVGRSTLAAMRDQGWSLADLTGHGTPAMREALAGQIQSARMDYDNPDYLRVDDYEDQPW